MSILFFLKPHYRRPGADKREVLLTKKKKKKQDLPEMMLPPSVIEDLPISRIGVEAERRKAVLFLFHEGYL